mmetsp:Transcript_18525/g.37947  ORF Transcript_18525/g.37947 Transcript_18525/m.37947 type:complete len:156 (+) Transcript_18525:144-611(+)|eukprot:CAMPEP_0201120564 /NCGR_PEP_ID=MMETSP0850-20130426/4611_1 /ASSEMBLY_ACC=CAM_ASM_000622 /TAXON_ID=183588 /ORGANISM="Pseudo-nitzschia fraudulenta, Strain WWA7" /LENGTH=155 /DNA_ID=CAMNT_0047386749 /DNA_START=92 /DNA_END=559 /DNA_ORIENTATION=-
MAFDGNHNESIRRIRRAKEEFTTTSGGGGLHTEHPLQESVADIPEEHDDSTVRPRFETPDAPLITSSSSTFPDVLPSDTTANGSILRPHTNFQQIAFFCVGAIMGLLLVGLVAFYVGRSRRRSKKKRKKKQGASSLAPFSQNIQFRDECDSLEDA